MLLFLFPQYFSNSRWRRLWRNSRLSFKYFSVMSPALGGTSNRPPFPPPPLLFSFFPFPHLRISSSANLATPTLFAHPTLCDLLHPRTPLQLYPSTLRAVCPLPSAIYLHPGTPLRNYRGALRTLFPSATYLHPAPISILSQRSGPHPRLRKTPK